MEDKRSREIQEFKKFLRESREKPDLDRYAQELFGERMEALGFTTFKNHRWYKLVRDELLLSFGLLPVTGLGTKSYAMYLGVQPLFSNANGHFSTKWSDALSYPYTSLVMNRGLQYPPDTHFEPLFEYEYIRRETPHKVRWLFDKIVEPTMKQCTNIRTAYQSICWYNFIARRNSLTPPIPPKNLGQFSPPDFSFGIFFRMYDEYVQGKIRFLARSWHLMDEQGRYDYDYVVQWLRERDRLPDGFEQIERGEYDALDAALHAEYEASLLTIKRRLKLEPDCKDTIWDRDYRHPIDIQKTIEEIFARCAPRAAQGDYTIDTL